MYCMSSQEELSEKKQVKSILLTLSLQSCFFFPQVCLCCHLAQNNFYYLPVLLRVKSLGMWTAVSVFLFNSLYPQFTSNIIYWWISSMKVVSSKEN